MEPDLPPAGDPETARVIALVSSIPLAVDLARFGLAEAAFDTEVLLDYTSLWGGEPELLTPAAIIAGWKALVPGFDATRHELTQVSAVIVDDRATARGHIDARHWYDGHLWRPVGVYHWKLTRRRHGWRVTAMTLEVTHEDGDRGLVAKATERAASR